MAHLLLDHPRKLPGHTPYGGVTTFHAIRSAILATDIGRGTSIADVLGRMRGTLARLIDAHCPDVAAAFIAAERRNTLKLSHIGIAASVTRKSPPQLFALVHDPGKLRTHVPGLASVSDAELLNFPLL